MAADFDYILVGGGLQSGLLALALRASVPQTRIALIERERQLGGNHIWCFHTEDLSHQARLWVAPLVCKRWPGYRVAFPHFHRMISGEYSAVTSDRLHDVVSSVIVSASGSELLFGEAAVRLDTDRVELEGGRILSGNCVIDARGPARNGELGAGYQKFLGLEISLERPHVLDLPVVMDAVVDQSDGFRFFYCLPLAEDRMLIEDTYFHESPALDRERARDEILAYAKRQGYVVKAVLREEVGILPMPWRGALPTAGGAAVVAGYRGGWFHPATGYSFPIAARFAECVAGVGPDPTLSPRFAALVRSQVSQARYCHLLNRFLFRWYAPSSRWNIFERFYRMPESTIHRFYALRLSAVDRFRLLVGRPPRGFSLRYRFRRGERS